MPPIDRLRMLKPPSTKRLLSEVAWRRLSGERATSAGLRAAITVPLPAALAPMRKLATDLAAARGALDVGFVVTVAPKGRLDLRVRKDGQEVDSSSTAKPLDIEARRGS